MFLVRSNVRFRLETGRLPLAPALFVGFLVIITIGLSTPLVSAQATPIGSITSYRVSGTPNYTSPGSEPFWKSISWTNASLAATVTPGGGHTPYVLAKSANNGFEIYMLFQWPDPAGPSYNSQDEIYTASNGSLVLLDQNSTATVKQLFYNSTYYYPDRVAVLWFIAPVSSQQQSPKMMLGSDGAITGGAAEIWHWQSNPTDNNPNDTGFPGGYTDPVGNPIYPPDNLSFAEDDYTNTTGFFVIAGSFGNDTPNLVPYADPYAIHVGSSYSYVNKTWTVEMVRALTINDGASKYRVQLVPGSTNYIAMAVWNGKLGESAHIKSVSLWYSLTVSDQGPSGATSTSLSTGSSSSGTVPGSVSVPLAAAVAVGVLIAGLVIGTVIRSPTKGKSV